MEGHHGPGETFLEINEAVATIASCSQTCQPFGVPEVQHGEAFSSGVRELRLRQRQNLPEDQDRGGLKLR
jgi:hypothetical protein